MKNLLINVLPNKVYVGKSPYSQPVYLDNNSFEYNVSNEVPKNIREGIIFINLKDLKSWVLELNSYINAIEKEYILLEKLKEISSFINKEFNFNYLPEIDLIFEKYDCNSVILTLKNLLYILTERTKLKNTFIIFLKNNSLCEDFNTLTLEELKKNILLQRSNSEYLKTLNNLYYPKLNTLESYEILKFSERCKTPFIITREFILSKISNKVEETDVEKIRQMRLKHLTRNFKI
jgi:hypothetical protein